MAVVALAAVLERFAQPHVEWKLGSCECGAYFLHYEDEVKHVEETQHEVCELWSWVVQ